jgi:beta-lactamase superfamily II metal-dependent hydrolase
VKTSRSRHPLLRLVLLASAVLACAALAVACAAQGGTPAAAPATVGGVSPKATPAPHPSRSSARSHGGGGGSAAPAARITFVNVGQGDATLLQIGSWTGLVDGGPVAAAGHLVAELRSQGVRRIDELVVTHPHADHIGGLPAVVASFPVGRAVIDESYRSASFRSLTRALAARHVPVVHWWRGARERLGRATARVLNPTPAPPDADPNDDSVVLLVSVAGRRVLLTGDAGGAAEDAIAAAYRGPPVFVLKVGHHGSRTSTGDTLLAAVRPTWAVIEVGPNGYGHPAPSVVARLRAHAVRILSTWRAGDITLTILSSGAVRWRWTGKGPGVTTGASAVDATAPGTTAGGADPVVFITSTGEKYHRRGCRYLARSMIPLRLSVAKARGYEPCSVCDPP